MRLDAAALERALGGAAPSTVHHQLCRAQIEAVRAAAAGGAPLLIACTQEAPLFAETLGQLEAAPPAGFVNIRERAGWSEEGTEAAPKIAALLAEAAIEVPPAPALTLKSEGRCLVVGIDDTALQAARQLASRLAPTLLLVADAEILPPRTTTFPILRGLVRGATGHLGAFKVEVTGLAPAVVSSRQHLRFGPAQAKAELEADLILDLTGGRSWFSAHAKRDGYLRPDPRDPVAVQRALFEAVELTGEFEKPRYVAFTAELCAHSRSRRTGCTRCLEQCPTGAIAPAGDHVRIDPYVCAGCGACAGVCPTGAAAYAVPSANILLERLRALLGTYRDAGGVAPVLLACEERHGEALIDAMARLGRGLPARVLPFAVTEIAQLGFETLAAAFAYGADQVVVLAPPHKRAEIGGLEATLGHIRAMLDGLGYGAERLLLLLEDDPDTVEAALWTLPRLEPVTAGDFLPMGGKRTLMRLALDQLHRTAPQPAEIVPLPAGAPFGAVVVDVAGCTLCLSCVGACPTGALLDAPDKPMLRFLEEACVQCGLCRSTCPEKVIRLEPRLAFTAAARSSRTIKEEEPALCIRCGKPFGTRSSIERIVEKLAGRSWMFQTEEQIARIRMCDDCRVISQFENARNPLAFGSRPKPRTSEDYLREREQPAAPPTHEPESESTA
ncbi:4Fe-4S binding protein [Benzoatithermus flavus]|uniref:4Fe-4S binding protein n=1 Tax=Benzoatithermus flavus TaxID=3108223 RepID=A0ABU8XMS5_9PROT